MAEPDWIARGLGGGSLLVAGWALYLNWLKNERDIADRRPQTTQFLTGETPRVWKFELVIKNPMPIPLRFIGVEARTPANCVVAERSAAPKNEGPIGLHNTVFSRRALLGSPYMIGPDASGGWNGYVALDPRARFRDGVEPVLTPLFSNLPEQPSRWRRIADIVLPIARRA